MSRIDVFITIEYVFRMTSGRAFSLIHSFHSGARTHSRKQASSANCPVFDVGPAPNRFPAYCRTAYYYVVSRAEHVDIIEVHP